MVCKVNLLFCLGIVGKPKREGGSNSSFDCQCRTPTPPHPKFAESLRFCQFFLWRTGKGKRPPQPPNLVDPPLLKKMHGNWFRKFLGVGVRICRLWIKEGQNAEKDVFRVWVPFLVPFPLNSSSFSSARPRGNCFLRSFSKGDYMESARFSKCDCMESARSIHHMTRSSSAKKMPRKTL